MVFDANEDFIKTFPNIFPSTSQALAHTTFFKFLAVKIHEKKSKAWAYLETHPVLSLVTLSTPWTSSLRTDHFP